MQKWEYLFVSAYYEHDGWHVKLINGKEMATSKTSITLYNYANQMGDEGWELVAAPYTSVASTNQVTGHIYDTEHYLRLIFKRPKS